MQAQGILLQVNLKYKQENQNNYPNNLPLICHSQFKNSISKAESVFESFHHLPLPPSSYPYWRENLRKEIMTESSKLPRYERTEIQWLERPSFISNLSLNWLIKPKITCS